MTTRRHFLQTTAGLGITTLAGGCAPSRRPKTTRHPRRRKAPVAGAGTDDVMWGADLRRDFRDLSLLVHERMVDPAPTRAVDQEIRQRFVALHQKLAAYPFSRSLAAAWLSFYRLTALLHDLRNTQAQGAALPVFAHNGHQHAARMWIEAATRGQGALPLLHVDTHADMRSVLQPDRVVRAVKQLRGDAKQRAKGRHQLRRLIVDHATPVSAGVLGDAVSDVIWAAPRWAYAPTFLRRPMLWATVPTTPQGHPLFQLFHDGSADPLGTLPGYAAHAWDEIDTIPEAAKHVVRHRRPRKVSFVQTYPTQPDTLGTLERALPAGRFVLDVDLDYFMSIDSDCGFSRRGRENRSRAEWDVEYGKRLRRGRALLDARLGDFRQLLVALRDHGRVPALVTLADSTYMPFFPALSGQAYWEYLPREFAGYLHWRVRHLLEEVYRHHGVAAGV